MWSDWVTPTPLSRNRTDACYPIYVIVLKFNKVMEKRNVVGAGATQWAGRGGGCGFKMVT